MVACWVKIAADDILKYFFLCFSENGFWHFMQSVSLEAYFLEKKIQKIFLLSSLKEW